MTLSQSSDFCLLSGGVCLQMAVVNLEMIFKQEGSELKRVKPLGVGIRKGKCKK